MTAISDAENQEQAKIVLDNNGRHIPKLWPARIAVKRLDFIMGSSIDVKLMLADKLRDGHIKAYAYQTWEVADSDFYKVWKSGPPEQAIQKAKINRSLMKRGYDWQNMFNQWDWQKGNFIVSHNTGKKFKFFQDVRFVADDIAKLRSAAEDAKLLKKGEGRRTKNDDWNDMWFAVSSVIADGELNKEKYNRKRGRQKYFFRAIELHFRAKEKKPPLGLQTFAPVINKVLEELVDDRNQWSDPSTS